MLNHKGTMKLETKRLILRQFKEEDAEEMYNNWASDSEVTKYLTWSAHNSVEVSKKVIEMWLDEYNNDTSYNWAIELKETGSIIGSIGLLNVNDEKESCEAGYCIGKEYWNKGVLTEALSSVIGFGFNDVGFQRIAACHHVNNPASGRVMEKCGMEYEGTLRKISRDNNGNLVDCKYYSILNSI